MRATSILSFAAAGVFALAHAPATHSAPLALGCVPVEKLECGCHIRVNALRCTEREGASGPQFVTGLADDAPLLIQLDGKDVALPHVRHIGTTAKGDTPGRWVDEYGAVELGVSISYAPGASTCPKTDGEGCEYSDYSAVVDIRRHGHPPLVLSASARCGC